MTLATATATAPDMTDHNLTNVIEAWTAFARLNISSNETRAGVRKVRVAGAEALTRLLPVALRDTGQSRVIARFLLNLYNGNRFPFDLADFRRHDHSLLVDCMTVLHMDYMPEQEVHRYFEHGGEIWEQMAENWRLNGSRGEHWG